MLSIDGISLWVPIFSLLTVVALLLFRQSIYHPVSLFAILWGFLFLIKNGSSALYESDTLATIIVVILLAATCIAPFLSGPLLTAPTPSSSAGLQNSAVGSRLSRGIVWISFPVALISGLAIQQISGVSPSLSLESLIGNAQIVSEARYSGGAGLPALVSIAFGIVYVAAALSTFAAEAYSGITKLAAVTVPIVGAATYAVITTARASFIIVVCLTVSSLIVKELLSHGSRVRVSFRALIVASSAGGATVLLFVSASILRYGGATPAVLEVTFRRIETYLVGSLAAFDQWYIGSDLPLASLGISSFSGVLGPLGRSEGDTRAYDSFVTVSDTAVTNVYTFFRGFLEDFGYLGGVLVVFGLLVVSMILFRESSFRRRVRPSVALIFLLAFFLFGPYLSLFSFTNFCVAFVVVVAFAPRFLRSEQRLAG